MPASGASATLLESIFGTPEEKFTRGIKARRQNRHFGMDEDYIEKAIEGMPVMGMTKYLKAGVPDKLGRMIGTETFKNKMRALGTNIGDEFAHRYPRIAAHISPYIETEKGIMGRARIGNAFKKDPREVEVGINFKESPNPRKTLAHEATHVAQKLGMGEKMQPVYNAAEEAVGYEMNPLEQSARRTALRYGFPGGRDLKPFKTRRALEAVAEMAPPDSPYADILLRNLGLK